MKRFIGYYQFWLIPGPVMLLAALFLGKVIFWGTASLQFIPWRVLAYEQLNQGILMPLWNPFNGMGAPLLANYQLAWFYPPSWILAIFYGVWDAPGVAWGYTFLVIVHLIWASLGMANLCKRIGLSPFAQIVSGLAFGMSGYIVARASFFSMVWAYAWLPWIIDQTSRISFPVVGGAVEEKRVVFPGLIAVIAMQLLAGHAQLCWYSLLLAGIWAVVFGWRNQKLRGSLLSGLKFALAAFIAACIAAVQLLPTAEYLSLSQRASSYDINSAFTYSFWPWRVITLLAPDFFGNPGRGDYWGYAAFWEDAIYIGVLPVYLAVCSFIFVRKKEEANRYKRLVLFLMVLIILAGTLALGKNTPVFPFLYNYVPSFNMFQAPARYLIWVVFGFSLLSGIGANFWLRPDRKGVRKLKIALTISVALIFAAGVAFFVLRGYVEQSSIMSLALLGFLSSIAAILAIKAPWKTATEYQVGGWHKAVIGFIIVDLLAAGYWLNPVIDRGFFNRTDVSVKDSSRVFMSADDEYVVKFMRLLNFYDLRVDGDWFGGRKYLMPNINILDDTPVIGNFDPILSKRYLEWMNWIESLDDNNRKNWLAFMDVGWINSIDENNIDLLTTEDNNSQARVHWYSCATSAIDEYQAFDLIKQVSRDDDFKISNFCPVIENGQQNFSRFEDTVDYDVYGFSEQYSRLSFQIKTGVDGWVVLSDLWYPYWKASVDGVEARIYPANYLFRAIEVPAGTHMIEFKYQPVPFYLGASISIIGLIVFIFILIRNKRGQKNERNFNGCPTICGKNNRQS